MIVVFRIDRGLPLAKALERVVGMVTDVERFLTAATSASIEEKNIEKHGSVVNSVKNVQQSATLALLTT